MYHLVLPRCDTMVYKAFVPASKNVGSLHSHEDKPTSHHSLSYLAAQLVCFPPLIFPGASLPSPPSKEKPTPWQTGGDNGGSSSLIMLCELVAGLASIRGGQSVLNKFTDTLASAVSIRVKMDEGRSSRTPRANQWNLPRQGFLYLS